jgi:hypothetical protein
VSLETRHNFQGWLSHQQEVQHLRGCRQGRATFPPETFPKETSRRWTAPTTPYLWAITIEKIAMMNAVLHPASGKEMQYKYIMQHPTLGPKYKTGFGNELGRLCQGIRDIQGTNTCFFVELSNMPKDRKITYGKLVCDHKPNKTDKERVRLTVDGNRLNYTSEVATSTAYITTFKILISSTLSTEDAEMTMMDIKNCYLGTPSPRY